MVCYYLGGAVIYTSCLPADLDMCGNGVVDAGEACDDGNTTDCDACSADCLTSPDLGAHQYLAGKRLNFSKVFLGLKAADGRAARVAVWSDAKDTDELVGMTQ